ncbi:DUF1214 domain-containing protein [Blastomonas aquatica]|uniref:DUF1214 domain-containing protein n=1 Tax=Blastomonas aquatica TaxID=1510276 RepID=A0ABQ1J707_9SPHN|nr:DUF1214 domain-containing protein [Blastomonas aquatica]GGB61572.1 hypothetical protein GCM10010833_15720 [Blastomonas aquatica]
MHAGVRYALMLVAGIALGSGIAVLQLRDSFAADGIANGPWRTAHKVGTADASVATRASIALRGLLALPEREAIYFNAASDSEGRALTGACRYRVTGGAIDARWWSLTLYDAKGYLIPNVAGAHSLGSAALSPAETSRWQVNIGPARTSAHWIAVPDDQPFELTLRAYHPSQRLLRERGTVDLPQIERAECKA